MGNFSIGQIVRITGDVMTGNVGTVVYLDEKRERYLVRIDGMTQNYFTADEIELYRS